MSTKRDYYEVLSVTKTADHTEIKRAYRKLALEYHPDRNPGDKKAEEMFKEAAEAYEVLSDQQKRSTYDRFGHQGLSGQGFSGFQDVGDVFSNFSSIFEDFFGFGGGGGNGARRGSDLRYDLEIEFEEAVFGIEKEIEYQKSSDCETCDGSGAKPGTKPKECTTCGGVGQVRRSQGFFSVATTCPSCRGAGAVVSDPCTSCRGKGITHKTKTLQVKIPAGVDNGVRLRVSGEGDSGGSGGPSGDLYVVLHVKESEKFEREDHTIILNQAIGMAQAALGCEIKVPTLEGEKTIEVAAGSQHGTQIRLSGLGVPMLRGLGRGDFVVILNVVVPRKLSKVQREALEKFAEVFEEDYSKDHHKGFFQRVFGGG